MLKEEDKEFESEDERYYFKNETSENNRELSVLLMVFIVINIYIFNINWTNLNQYSSIKSEEKYPEKLVIKDQIAYFGKDYSTFKKESKVNEVLNAKEVEKYWSNCIGSCEIPSSDRFQYISDKKEFINWVCNERTKEQNYSATKYTVWKLNKEGCILTNLEEVKMKDKKEISDLRWEKQKEMEIYLGIFLFFFLGILHCIKKIIQNKRIK